MTRVLVNVDADEVLDDLDTETLAKALVSRSDGAVEFAKAAGQIVAEPEDLEVDFRELVEAYRLGNPFEPMLSTMAWNHLGRML